VPEFLLLVVVVVVLLLLWEGRADECVWARVRAWIDDGCREREREKGSNDASVKSKGEADHMP
jgi:hypothetical protein